MSNEYKGVEHEVVPGALRGYRAWQLGPNGLHACNWSQYYWSPGRNVAMCLSIAHGNQNPYALPCNCADCQTEVKNFSTSQEPAPLSECQCGFYAKHDPGDYDTRGQIGGVIKAYGKVILGTLGFRAQYAEIEALFLGVQHVRWYDSKLISDIQEKYGVPFYNSEAEMLRNFPPISVKELLPEEPEGVDLNTYFSANTITITNAQGKTWVLPAGSWVHGGP